MSADTDKLIAKLRAKDAQWQELCDRWETQATEHGLDVAEFTKLRPTIEAEAADRIASLEKALAPFAEALPLLFNDWCPDDTPAWWIDGEQPGDENRSPVSVGDFRRAAALSSSRQKDGE